MIVALWAAWTLPLLLGERTLFLRDVLTTHVPYKAFGASELAEGSVPAINPTWNLGQPFRGNPNALAFYPGNVLYLLLPFASAFHLHFALHWLLGFLGLRALARELGQSEGAALLAALAWAGSGYFLSLLTFYNLIAVCAWVPWTLLGLARGGARGIALAGISGGLLLLAGEPVTAALLLPAFLLVLLERRTLRPALRVGLASGLLALLVALPQIVATARVMGFSFRSARGLDAGDTALQALHPLRLLELLLPLPWGSPAELGRFGYWSERVTPHVPYIYSLHVGVVAAGLACFALRHRRRWFALALAGVSLAWAGGLSGEITSRVTLGLFRYPQKTLLLFTLAMALLAGWGFDGLRDRSGSEDEKSDSPGSSGIRSASRFAWAASVCGVMALALFAFQPKWVALVRFHLANGANETLARTATAQWIVGFAIAAALLAGAAWAISRRRWTALIGIQVLGLAGLVPVVPWMPASELAGTPPFARHMASPPSAVVFSVLRPEWEPWPAFRLGTAGLRGAAKLGWQNVEPAFGVPLGIEYPVAPDLEGITSPLTVLVLRNLRGATWPARTEWLRRYGVGWVVRSGSEEVAGLERVDVANHWGVETGLDRVTNPAGRLRWPGSVSVAASPLRAYGEIGSGKAGSDIAVASRAVEHRAGARVDLIEEQADRIVADVEGAGGLLVVTRAWQPLYRARLADGTVLRTQPVDVALLGVEVPAGRQRVTIDVSSVPEKIAGAIALAVALGLVVLLLRSRA